MAIFCCSFKTLSRNQGRNAVVAAAYRAGTSLYCDALNKTVSYSKKSDVLHSEIMLPAHAPDSLLDREKLWNAVENAEKRINSRVAREVLLALPKELSFENQKKLILDFVKKQFIDLGMCADIAIHAGTHRTNPHAHVLLTTREVTRDKFTCKNRQWDKKEFLCHIRREWADWQNVFLAQSGCELRVDHRSHKERGIELEPSLKLCHEKNFSNKAQLLRKGQAAIKERNGKSFIKKSRNCA